MRQRADGIHRGAGRKILGVASLLVMVAAFGCDSSIDVRAPQLPTVPIPPAAPTGPTVTESRAIAGVSGVSLEAVGLVEIDPGAMDTLLITAPERVMSLLTSDVVGGLLVLGSDSEGYEGQVSDIRYDLTVRRLERLLLRGVGEIRARGVDTGRFVVDLAGVGEIRASGRVDRQEVRVAGVGSYFAARLRSRVTRVEVTAGRAQVWATERIEGFVGAGCVLEYWGDPVIEIQGLGTVRRLETRP